MPGEETPLQRWQALRTDGHDVNIVHVQPGVGKDAHPYEAGESFMLVLRGRLDVTVDGLHCALHPGQMLLLERGANRGFTAGPEGAVFVAAHLRG